MVAFVLCEFQLGEKRKFRLCNSGRNIPNWHFRSSHCNLSNGTWFLFVPLLMTLTLMARLRWYLPVFSIKSLLSSSLWVATLKLCNTLLLIEFFIYYSLTYLYQWLLIIHFYSIQWVVICYFHYLFWCSRFGCPRFGQQKPLYAGFHILLSYPHHFVSTSLLTGTRSSSYIFPALVLESALPARNPGSFQWRIVFRDQDLGWNVFTVIEVSLLQTFSVENARQCMCVCIHRYTHAFIHIISIFLSRQKITRSYQYIQFQWNTTHFILKVSFHFVTLFSNKKHDSHGLKISSHSPPPKPQTPSSSRLGSDTCWVTLLPRCPPHPRWVQAPPPCIELLPVQMTSSLLRVQTPLDHCSFLSCSAPPNKCGPESLRKREGERKNFD